MEPIIEQTSVLLCVQLPQEDTALTSESLACVISSFHGLPDEPPTTIQRRQAPASVRNAAGESHPVPCKEAKFRVLARFLLIVVHHAGSVPLSFTQLPPTLSLQMQGWSFTGPPPGHAFGAAAGHIPNYGIRPAGGPAFPPQPQMNVAGHVPGGPMFHCAHSQFPPFGAAPQHFMARPPQMQPHGAASIRPRPPAQSKYVCLFPLTCMPQVHPPIPLVRLPVTRDTNATIFLVQVLSPGPRQAGAQGNKKEREKAKRERKEARKLAEQPMPIMTEDAQPRDFLNDTERQETQDWIAERKARFPTKENLAKKQEAIAAVVRSGARSRCQRLPPHAPTDRLATVQCECRRHASGAAHASLPPCRAAGPRVPPQLQPPTRGVAGRLFRSAALVWSPWTRHGAASRLGASHP